MAILKKEVKHIAYLARLRLKEQEIKHYQKELSEILDFVAQLSRSNDKGKDSHKKIVIANNFRRDNYKKRTIVQSKDLIQQKFLEKGYLKIPSIFKQ